jgi:hypothetical protein
MLPKPPFAPVGDGTREPWLNCIQGRRNVEKAE